MRNLNYLEIHLANNSFIGSYMNAISSSLKLIKGLHCLNIICDDYGEIDDNCLRCFLFNLIPSFLKKLKLKSLYHPTDDENLQSFIDYLSKISTLEKLDLNFNGSNEIKDDCVCRLVAGI